MNKRSRSLLVLAGMVAGAVGALLLTSGRGAPAQAQPDPGAVPAAAPVPIGPPAAKPGEAGRYQISAWAVATQPPLFRTGAYVIDTQTGEVFSVADDGTK